MDSIYSGFVGAITDKKQISDIVFYDNIDLSGLVFKDFKSLAIDNIITDIQKATDAIRLRPVVLPGNIFRGRVISGDDRYALVETEFFVGVLPHRLSITSKIPEEELIVQIVDINPKRGIELTEFLQIDSDNLALVQGRPDTCNTGISPDFQDYLFQLSKNFAPDGWGVHWFRSAEGKPLDYLERELSEVIERMEKIEQEIKENSYVCGIKNNETYTELIFHYSSKLAMDRIIGADFPYYHYFHSCGSHVSYALDILEGLDIDKTEASRVLYKKIIDSALSGKPAFILRDIYGRLYIFRIERMIQIDKRFFEVKIKYPFEMDILFANNTFFIQINDEYYISTPVEVRDNFITAVIIYGHMGNISYFKAGLPIGCLVDKIKSSEGKGDIEKLLGYCGEKMTFTDSFIEKISKTAEVIYDCEK